MRILADTSRRVIASYFKGLAAIAFVAIPIDAAALGDSCAPSDTARSLPAHGERIALGPVADGSILEIRERGQSISLVAPPESIVASIPIPPRYGFFIVGPTKAREVTVQRTEHNSARGAVYLRVHCLDEARVADDLDTWTHLNEIATSARGPIDRPVAAALIAKLNVLADAASPTQAALIEHMRAQFFLLSGQYTEASEGFRKAEAAWSEAGDADRAAVARVGQTEEAQRTGNYRRVLELAPMPGPADIDFGYFRVRLTTSRCIALDYLGRYAQSKACYRWALRHLQSLDEQLEYANTLRNYAFLLWETGHSTAAEATAARALEAARGTNAAVVKGRVHSLLADMRLSRGDVVAALREADSALCDFIEAKSQRWQVDALLKIASLYGELGAYDDAYVAIRKAVEQISPRDTPARAGAALMVMADVDLMNAEPKRASVWARTAKQIYDGLEMPAEAEEARWLKLRAALATNDLGEVDEGLAETPHQAARHEADRALVVADVAMRRGDTESAARAFGELRKMGLRLPERLRVQTLEAAYWRRLDNAKRADSILARARDEIAQLANSTENPILRFLLTRENRPLATEAFQGLLDAIALNATAKPEDIELAWRWAAATSAKPARMTKRENPPRDTYNRFDEAVANELLGVSTAASTPEVKRGTLVEHNRLALLADRPVMQRTASSMLPEIRELQATLENGAVLVSYLEGHTHGALLIVTPSSASIVKSLAPLDLKEHLRRLRVLASPRETGRDIDSEARALSSLLWNNMPADGVPKKIFVLAGSAIDALPFSLLYWPGESSPLVDTTTVQFVDVERIPANASWITSLPATLHVVVAAQVGPDTHDLPTLFNASAEPAAIRRVADGVPIFVEESQSASREAVIGLLQRPNDWIHIAAHGTIQPNRLGYAGVWLGSSGPGASTEFLSWLEVLNRGVHSDLVVLNACSLADSGDALRSNLSFASAVLLAGARQVVAGLWPVSDSASAIWVPAFYEALVADPGHDAAAAVGAAQRALRKSRLYRHPFYWASLASFGHLQVPAATATTVRQ